MTESLTITLPRAALQTILELAVDRSIQHGYGHFPGGDPRTFTPDSDSMPDELEAHRLACEAWERGDTSGGHAAGQPFDGGILTFTRYGLGSYAFADEEMVELAKSLREAGVTLEPT